MNNLTQDELRIIWLSLNGNHYRTLKAKIKILLDNYCEHEPSDAHYEMFRWQLCKKCGIQYK